MVVVVGVVVVAVLVVFAILFSDRIGFGDKHLVETLAAFDFLPLEEPTCFVSWGQSVPPGAELLILGPSCFVCCFVVLLRCLTVLFFLSNSETTTSSITPKT